MLTQDAKRLGIHKSQNTPAAKKARAALAKAEKVRSDAQGIFDSAKMALDGLAEDATSEKREEAIKAVAGAESALVAANAKVDELKK